MASRGGRFNPEILLSAPRRGAAVPDPTGSRAVYTVSTYSLESHKKTSEIRVLDLSIRQSTLITNEEKASEPNWLEDELLWLKEGAQGTTELVVGDAVKVGSSYIAGTVSGSIANIKLKALEQGRVAIVVSGKATPDGTLYNGELESKKLTTGRLYDSTMVRHWDEYVTNNKNALWYGLLEKANGQWSLSSLTNALKDTLLESPIPTFGGKDNFDISTSGLVFVSKDPDLNPAFNTKCNFYHLPIHDFTKSTMAKPLEIGFEGLDGAATSPVFSPDGHSAAFLKMKQNGYESDKNRIVLATDLGESASASASELLGSSDGRGSWDKSPSALRWSDDGRMLFTLAEEEGNDVLFKLELPTGPTDATKLPEPLTGDGAVSDMHPLREGSNHLLVSSSTLIDNSVYSVVDPSDPDSIETVSSNSDNGASFGLSSDQISDIWFEGSGNYKVHALVVKPSNFSQDTKYPLAYLIHGGPQGAWTRSWSTRWNPAVFAEQGYVVICPNPTGSTGYGQAFVDAIRESWGGLPYEDLVKGFDFVRENLSYVDTSRAVALGASYGGYMMNWFQGHALSKEFKALVCHDGVFSMANQMSSDEQYFPGHDLGGPYWQAKETWEKWNPARFTGNWSTPMLVIHNELDYRLPISEGLAMFNVLQERGIDSRFLTFSDENHWVLKPENSLVWHTVVLNWINRYTGLPEHRDENALLVAAKSIQTEANEKNLGIQ
ncbi:MAG: hypothetical protein Q9190_002238 [Brigantiaea leucoxantha]